MKIPSVLRKGVLFCFKPVINMHYFRSHNIFSLFCLGLSLSFDTTLNDTQQAVGLHRIIVGLLFLTDGR